jgi:tryptophan synthase alpha chain
MDRFRQLFTRKPHRVLNVYCTAGYPTFDSTLSVMQALQKHGADLIELGMPYSDPLADGPVIQASSGQALESGMTIQKLFEQLHHFREKIVLPVVLMGYMNPVLQYGFEKFCTDAAACGIDGLILPDLPMHEFDKEFGPIIQKHNLNFIFLITPETSNERIKALDQRSSGFLYAVSSSSITGGNKALQLESYGKRLQSLQLQNPVLVGFGVKDNASFEEACRYTNGAIIGSAYIKALENKVDIEEATEAFLSNILQ